MGGRTVVFTTQTRLQAVVDSPESSLPVRLVFVHALLGSVPALGDCRVPLVQMSHPAAAGWPCQVTFQNQTCACVDPEDLAATLAAALKHPAVKALLNALIAQA